LTKFNLNVALRLSVVLVDATSWNEMLLESLVTTSNVAGKGVGSEKSV
jgi:hypothetical protein